jgi:hypothetical protein
LAGVARVSHAGNAKHNPGEPLHHARGKSTDHVDCILRHLVDLHGLLASLSRDEMITVFREEIEAAVLSEASALAWRALALSQELHERFGAPLAPGARLPTPQILAPGPLSESEVQAAIAADAPFILTPNVVPQPPAPFGLKLGKRYLQRNGEITAPLNHSYNPLYPLRDGSTGYAWTVDGSYYKEGPADPRDLIAEYTGP